MADLDDVELIAQVAQGNERAFLALYDRYASRVHALSLRVLHDSMLAEEATQDTFVKLWSRAHLFSSERGTPLLWLLTIARRTALDHVRLEARRPLLSDSNDPDDMWQTIPDGDSLSEESRWRALYFAVQTLSAEHRQVIELAYYQGLKSKRDCRNSGLAARDRQDPFARRHGTIAPRMEWINPNLR